ncbi:MAG: hypothetical protein QM809_11390 [Gordonia sp. (in: high G+C Gram-positive bacteria)]|uniref:hypothetical protein n=1 Tax=Gordonia sp. (in: high G+C Gram-positive bacteria) TaxID=84139 RepID=UPI0039E52D3F
MTSDDTIELAGDVYLAALAAGVRTTLIGKRPDQMSMEAADTHVGPFFVTLTGNPLVQSGMAWEVSKFIDAHDLDTRWPPTTHEVPAAWLDLWLTGFRMGARVVLGALYPPPLTSDELDAEVDKFLAPMADDPCAMERFRESIVAVSLDEDIEDRPPLTYGDAR